MQGTQTDPWSRNIPHSGATKPKNHNYWSLSVLQPVLRNKGSDHNEKPKHRNQRKPAVQQQRPSMAKKKEEIYDTFIPLELISSMYIMYMYGVCVCV